MLGKILNNLKRKFIAQPEQSRLPLVWHKAKHHSRKIYDKTKDYLIPHEGNNHLPQALKHRFLVFYSALLIVLKVVAIVLPVALPSSSLYSSAITLQNIVDLTNQTRSNLGLGELKVNGSLTQAAQAKANDMLLNQYFSHTSPQGLTPWDWIEKTGYDYRLAGENLAVHFQEAEDVQSGWLASPTHRANIVNSRYSVIGVGIARGQFEQVDSVIVVQMFGEPMSKVVAVNNTPPQTVTTTPKKEVSPVPPVKVTTPTKTVAAVEDSKENVNSLQLNKKIESDNKTISESPTMENSDSNLIKDSGSVGLGNEQTILETNNPVKVSDNHSDPIIYDSSLKINQLSNYYKVSLAVTGASAVALRLGEEWVMMGLDGPGTVWQAEVPFNGLSFNPSGEQLSAIAWGNGGTVTNKALALLAPQTKLQQFYTFNEGADKYAKFFGFLTVHNLQDKVSQFYLFFMVFLGAALLLNIFIKIRIQHYSVISHALAVIALALFLVIV